MTANWPFRRVVFWAVIVGFAAWVVTNPSHAGHTVADAVTTVLGWCESAFTALVTFVQNVTR